MPNIPPIPFLLENGFAKQSKSQTEELLVSLFVLNSHSNAIFPTPQHIYMCRPACPKWEYIVSLLSRILNASDGEEKVFWLVERILWCARCTSETRTRVPLHSTPLLVHSTSSSTCTSCSPPTGRRSPPRSRENSEKNSDLLPFVIWTLVCLSPSD